MAARDPDVEQDKLHAGLISKLNSAIVSEKFQEFKTFFLGKHGLPARDTEAAKTPGQLFTLLKRNDVIRVGKYDDLKKAFETLSMSEEVKTIESYEARIQELGEINQPIATRESGYSYTPAERRTFIHNQLLEDLARDTTIESEVNEMKSMALTATAWLKQNGCPFHADDLISPKRLFEELYNWSVIGIGDYNRLKDLFRQIQRKDKLRMIDKAERELALIAGKTPVFLNPEEDTPDAGTQPETAGDRPSENTHHGSVRDPDLEYKVPPSSEGKAGLMLIFNQFTEERHGTKNDATRLKKLFTEKFNFTVKLFENIPKTDVMKKMETYGYIITDDKYNQFYYVMLSHGDEEGIYTSNPPGDDFDNCKDDVIKIDEILPRFACDKVKQLARKPKVFIFQACRGEGSQQAIKVDRPGVPQTQPAIDSVLSKQYLPKDADFLIAQSQTENYVSFRDPYQGSWFIQSLCDVFEKQHERHSVVDMLTMVSDQVSKSFVKLPGSDTFSCQMPCFVSTLRKKLYL